MPILRRRNLKIDSMNKTKKSIYIIAEFISMIIAENVMVSVNLTRKSLEKTERPISNFKIPILIRYLNPRGDDIG